MKLVYLNKVIGATMHSVTWNQFLFKNLLVDSNSTRGS